MYCSICLLIWFCLVVGDLGGGVRVRTRNALHEVGAQSQRASDSAVSPRVRWESQNDNHIMRTTTSHFQFIIFSYFYSVIISYFMLSPTLSKNIKKT